QRAPPLAKDLAVLRIVAPLHDQPMHLPERRHVKGSQRLGGERLHPVPRARWNGRGHRAAAAGEVLHELQLRLDVAALSMRLMRQAEKAGLSAGMTDAVKEIASIADVGE